MTEWKRNEFGVIELHHDYETKCELNLRTVGAFKYGMHKSCDILLLAWGTTVDDIEIWEPHKQRRPPRSLIRLLEDDEVELHAHNAQFEYIISKYVGRPRYGFPEIDPARYHCTAAACAAAGLPRALGNAGRVLNLDIQKDKRGDQLIKIFCSPQPAKKPTKANPNGVPAHWLGPHDRPVEWEEFKSYNIDDVRTEMLIPEHVPMLNAKEQLHFTYDLMMNDRGLPLDMDAVNAAMPTLTELENRVTRRVRKLTGGINPTQRDKMLEFFNELGLELENLQAKTLKDIITIKGDDLDPQTLELLMLRLEGGKASTKKLKKMLALVCDDGRIRGGFLFFGAHTGRWCVAQGELVHTGRGLLPIENVIRGDTVWDGTAWVSCDGVVESGVHNTVVKYGIHATEDHKVWETPNHKVPLRDAQRVLLSLPSGISSTALFFQMVKAISVLATTLTIDTVTILKTLLVASATRCTKRYAGTARQSLSSLGTYLRQKAHWLANGRS